MLRHRVNGDHLSGVVHLPSTTPAAVKHGIRLEQPIVLVQDLKVRRHEDCERNNRVASVCARPGEKVPWTGYGMHGLARCGQHVLVFSARWLYHPSALTAEPVVTALAEPNSRPELRSGQQVCSSYWG